MSRERDEPPGVPGLVARSELAAHLTPAAPFRGTVSALVVSVLGLLGFLGAAGSRQFYADADVTKTMTEGERQKHGRELDSGDDERMFGRNTCEPCVQFSNKTLNSSEAIRSW